jgi:hypothetical protein
MALKNVVPADHALRVSALVIYMYADPGIGKTSLAYTASKPILFDFDAGAHRAGKMRRGTTVQVEKWEDVADIEETDVAAFDTVILDTAGRMLDLIKTHLLTNKNNRQSDGALKLKAQGYANDMFKSWIGRVRSYGKDVVILAHATEEKKGNDDFIIRPDVGGRNKNELYRQADMMGYLTNVDGQNGKATRMLNFIPSTAYHAKNSGNIGNVALPDLAVKTDFLANLIDDGKAFINSLTEEQVLEMQYQDDLSNWINSCENCESASDLNELLGSVDKNHKYLADMRKHIVLKARTLPVALDKEAGRYIEKDDFTDQPPPDAPQDVQDNQPEMSAFVLDLIKRAQDANSPQAAKALMNYNKVKTLPDLEKNALLDAVTKRLDQLAKPNTTHVPPPSLADLLAQAPDLDTLSILCGDIEMQNQALQPALYVIYDRRFAELGG